MDKQNDKPVGQIYETYDYSKFKYLIGNRQDAERRKGKVGRSIKKNGYVIGLPIVVNENYEIGDGQARFLYCKENGLPVYYTVCEGLKLEQCIDLNIGQTNWRLVDYIDSYAEKGNENYVLLKKLMGEFKAFTAADICGIVENQILTNGYHARSIKDEEVVVSNADYARTRKTLEYLEEIRPFLDKIPGQQRAIRTSVAWIINTTSCDKNRLKSVVKKRYPEIGPVCESVIFKFLEDLSRIYNARIDKSKQIDFDSEYKVYLRIK